MNWKLKSLMFVFLVSTQSAVRSEVFRLETIVYQEDQSCKYTLSRPDWQHSIKDLLRDILNINIQYVRLEPQRMLVTNLGNGNAVKFKTKYRGMSGDDNNEIYEIIEIEGMAILGKDGIFIKVTNTNHVTKPYLSGKFITCEPVSVPHDARLTLEDMKKMETNRVREFERKSAGALDEATGFMLKRAADTTGSAKHLIKSRIDAYVEETKTHREKGLKSKDTSALEWSNHRAIEAQYNCNILFGGDC
ncbi:hypothetical protein [Agrobacterium bohemicum]|uniref:Uncharacterized protein n=1 Tax=Agrobacterium bohemicum TaxID=2052828 RepID=A0A135P879_9HYPH|nr:hypothetical protein [Agrobacterium bohemicum]KXG87606.1 hypothetical protein ATO67_18335 [Agrobacterium bohemicum]